MPAALTACSTAIRRASLEAPVSTTAEVGAWR
jgi:hypothetical protein